MTAHTRLTAAVVIAGTALTALVLAQGGEPQGQTPAGQPAGQQPAVGRGQDAGQRGAGRGAGQGAQGRGGGQRRGGFTQYTRQQASQDVLVRGKGLYEAN